MRFALKNISLPAAFLGIVIFVSAPVVAVRYFVNQDASAHVYNAFLMNELLRGGSFATHHVTFNSLAVPDASGHWMLAAMLLVVSPFTANKIMLMLIFAGTVAASGWLRWKTRGDGVATALLIGGAVGINAFWLVGFYNYLIGFVISVFVLGLYHDWRERMDLKKCTLLSLLLLATYLSHLVSFAALAGAICLLALFASGRRASTLGWTVLAMVPTIPLMAAFRRVSEPGGEFFPQWRLPEGVPEFQGWLIRLAATDPFALISKRRLPFTDAESVYAMALSPPAWIAAIIVILAVAAMRWRSDVDAERKAKAPYLLMLSAGAAVALFGPDDFGSAHGGLLRGRIALSAVVCILPLFDVPRRAYADLLLSGALAFVIVMQTAAVWEFALVSDRKAEQLMAVAHSLESGDAIASLVIDPVAGRFVSVPEPQLGPLAAFRSDVVVWDNYELGHHLFPLIAREASVRKFVLEHNAVAISIAARPNSSVAVDDASLARLAQVMGANHHRITKLILWGEEPRTEAIISTWFVIDRPVAANGNIRVLRHR